MIIFPIFGLMQLATQTDAVSPKNILLNAFVLNSNAVAIPTINKIAEIIAIIFI
jgi:hypothetical protein